MTDKTPPHAAVKRAIDLKYESLLRRKSVLAGEQALLNLKLQASGREPARSLADTYLMKNTDKLINAAARDPHQRAQIQKVMDAHKAQQQKLGNRAVVSAMDPAYDPDNTPEREALRDIFRNWVKTNPFVMQTPHRAAHKGIAALGLHIGSYRGQTLLETVPLDQASIDLQVVAVEHDWAKLFHGAKIEGAQNNAEEWKLPYDWQVFEFAVSGACVLACAVAEDDGRPNTVTVAMRPPGRQEWIVDDGAVQILPQGWAYINSTYERRQDDSCDADFDRLYDFLFEQIRAVCIMLESEVAQTEAIRAPYKSNRPPTEKKPLPSLSHHIIRLSRKARPSPLPAADHVPGTRKRLHFRRGHWRHYTNHKTYVKWMLVGDPDLGFVEHEYRV